MKLPRPTQLPRVTETDIDVLSALVGARARAVTWPGTTRSHPRTHGTCGRYRALQKWSLAVEHNLQSLAGGYHPWTPGSLPPAGDD
jgi:hypothetical protein